MSEIHREQLQKCCVCRQGVMACKSPMFWTVSITRFVVDARAVQRLHGLELMLGSPSLAHVMSDDAPLANALGEAVELFVCDQCAMGDTPLAVLAEMEPQPTARKAETSDD